MENINQIYDLWCKRVTDPAIAAELNAIIGDDDAILDRFYRNLEFGTAGLRGVIGAGTNRMNIYTVARATQGFSEYIRGISEYPSVAIAYDSRINSDLFSKTAASVFAANGIKVWGARTALRRRRGRHGESQPVQIQRIQSVRIRRLPA